jgi:predicted HAD superfamily phosphohydrolase YqeG
MDKLGASSRFQMIIYVDVDDTLVRSAGSKRMPIPAVVQHVKDLKAQGAELYCWSSGGSAYARESAEELGIAYCFEAFLPKPQVMIDDQAIGDWRRLIGIYPTECDGKSVAEYRALWNAGWLNL